MLHPCNRQHCGGRKIANFFVYHMFLNNFQLLSPIFSVSVNCVSPRKWNSPKNRKQTPSQVQEQANFGDAKEFFPDSPKLARKTLQKMWPPKKSSPCQFGRHYFQIRACCWAPFLLRFSGSFRRLSVICPDFMGLCPDFHQIKTFGGEVAPPAPPPSTPMDPFLNLFQRNIEKVNKSVGHFWPN